MISQALVTHVNSLLLNSNTSSAEPLQKKALPSNTIQLLEERLAHEEGALGYSKECLLQYGIEIDRGGIFRVPDPESKEYILYATQKEKGKSIKLGEGGLGKVKVIENQKTGELKALKTLNSLKAIVVLSSKEKFNSFKKDLIGSFLSKNGDKKLTAYFRLSDEMAYFKQELCKGIKSRLLSNQKILNQFDSSLDQSRIKKIISDMLVCDLEAMPAIFEDVIPLQTFNIIRSVILHYIDQELRDSKRIQVVTSENEKKSVREYFYAAKRDFIREASILKKLGCSDGNVLHKKIDPLSVSLEKVSIILDLVPGKDLFEHLLSEELTTKQRFEIAIQVVIAVEDFHAKGFLHRDIKIENFMYDLSTKKLTIIDFGFAVEMSESMTAVAGTLNHIAPEIFHGKKYSIASDVFALGVAISDILAVPLVKDRGKVPLKKEISKGVKIQLEFLLNAMVSTFPEKRPSLSDIKQKLQKLFQREFEPSKEGELVVNTRGILSRITNISVTNKRKNTSLEQFHNKIFLQEQKKEKIANENKIFSPVKGLFSPVQFIGKIPTTLQRYIAENARGHLCDEIYRLENKENISLIRPESANDFYISCVNEVILVLNQFLEYEVTLSPLLCAIKALIEKINQANHDARLVGCVLDKSTKALSGCLEQLVKQLCNEDVDKGINFFFKF